MTVTLYTNSSDNKVVSKSITQIDSKTCNPFKEISIIAPVIIVAGEISASANYMYIDKFNRYYYITNIVYNGNQSLIYGRVDVLKTYACNIYGSTQYVSRGEIGIDYTIPDNMLPIDNFTIPHVVQFGNSVKSSPETFIVGII